MKYTDEYLITQSNKYKTKKEFREGNPSLYNTVQRRKLFEKTNLEWQKNWTYKELQKEALKYTIKGHFYNQSPNAYFAARRKGILDEICSHMKKQYEDWSNEKLHKEALKYKTRSEFQNKNKAYKTAQKRGVLDEICSHMQNVKYEDKKLLYKNRPTILYYIKINNIYKIGITLHEKYTNPVDSILKQRYSGKLAKNNTIEIIDHKIYNNGLFAYINEQEIIEMYKEKKYLGENFITESKKPGGESECFIENIYDDIKYFFDKI